MCIDFEIWHKTNNTLKTNHDDETVWLSRARNKNNTARLQRCLNKTEV